MCISSDLLIPNGSLILGGGCSAPIVIGPAATVIAVATAARGGYYLSTTRELLKPNTDALTVKMYKNNIIIIIITNLYHRRLRVYYIYLKVHPPYTTHHLYNTDSWLASYRILYTYLYRYVYHADIIYKKYVCVFIIIIIIIIILAHKRRTPLSAIN